ncbi:hypothetical protein HYW76_05155 [Candidatus Pacearchaeota archaeon]|nr:hypothetical protein [Candidatus Pacearchaeota archaeon]
MKNIYWSIIIFTLIILSSGAVFGEYQIKYEQVGDKFLVSYNISLNNESEITIEAGNPKSINSNVDYTLNNGNIELTGKNIYLSYIDSELIEKSGNKYYFVSKNNIRYESDMEIALELDEGFVLERENIYPKNFKISSNGRNIVVKWKTHIMDNEDFPIFAVIEKTGRRFTYTYLVLGVVLVLLAVFMYFKYFRSKDYNYLIESEKKVIEEIKKAERKEMWQKQLQIKTGFSKAKLSRVIRNLEERGLTKKIPFGNTNKIKLK